MFLLIFLVYSKRKVNEKMQYFYFVNNLFKKYEGTAKIFRWKSSAKVRYVTAGTAETPPKNVIPIHHLASDFSLS